MSKKHTQAESAVAIQNPEESRFSEGAIRILSAAEPLFAEQGFDAVSMSQIAQQAGISKANIYHHFKTKTDLYAAVLSKACRESEGIFHHFVTGKGDFRKDLAAFAGAHLQKLLDNATFSRLILRELLEDGPKRGQELAQHGFSENFSRLVGLLRERQERGEFRATINVPMLATLLIGANVFFFESRDLFRHYMEVDFADDPARYTHMLMDVILHGILPETVRDDGAEGQKQGD